MNATSTEFLLRRLQQEKIRIALATCDRARELHRILAARYACMALAEVRDSAAASRRRTMPVAN